jgi:mannose-6-phosphate isomerase-like protein (cupin superfamily)
MIPAMTAAARHGETVALQEDLTQVYGARFFAPGSHAVVEARPTNLYHYRAFIGAHDVAVEAGDCVYGVGDDARSAVLRRGPIRLASRHLAIVVRGYMPEDKTTTIQQGTTLPYVNGCSTKQLFPAERPGDPTLQLLYMPPHTTEQVHHIHSTVRVVYVMTGRGISVVGLGSHTVRHELSPGTVCVLEPMCPHHFETGAEPLLCIPLHIFSSTGRQEWEHPMLSGTHLIDRK